LFQLLQASTETVYYEQTEKVYYEQTETGILRTD